MKLKEFIWCNYYKKEFAILHAKLKQDVGRKGEPEPGEWWGESNSIEEKHTARTLFNIIVAHPCLSKDK